MKAYKDTLCVVGMFTVFIVIIIDECVYMLNLMCTLTYVHLLYIKPHTVSS